MRALVTGTAGFIGSRLASVLVGSGSEVLGIDSFSPYYDTGLKRATAARLATELGVRIIEADLAEADVRSLLSDVDVVFHLAAQPGVRASWDDFPAYVRDNLTATQRLLDAAQTSDIQRFVFASSSSVYGQATGTVAEDSPTQPFSPYGVTKLAADTLCAAYAENFDVPTVALRLFTVYGPGQRPDMAFSRLIEAALTGTPFPLYGDGGQVRAFTYVDDVIDAMVRAATTDLSAGTVMNISSGSVSTLRDAIDIVEDAVGLPVRLEHHADQAGDVRRTDADVNRARRLLDWSPKTPLDEGLRRQVQFARQRLGEAQAKIAVS